MGGQPPFLGSGEGVIGVASLLLKVEDERSYLAGAYLGYIRGEPLEPENLSRLRTLSDTVCMVFWLLPSALAQRR